MYIIVDQITPCIWKFATIVTKNLATVIKFNHSEHEEKEEIM